MADDQGLGVDIRVLPDLDEDERLVEGLDCLAQDILLRLDNPTGLADGTDEGAVWGYDLSANVNESTTGAGLLEIAVQVELQCESDDRCDRARVTPTFDPVTRALTLQIDLEIGAAPHSLTIEATAETLALLEQPGD